MSTLNHLRELLKTAKDNQKTAAAKAAFSGVDSAHPTDKQDDGTMPVKEGPRGSEHEKDLKAVPGPNNVIDAPEAKPDEQNSVQMNVGLTSKTVGSDPENEKPDRMKPEDTQKTTHPADAEKMAAADLHRLFESSANGMLAKIAAAAKPGAPATPEHKAAAAGYVDATSAIDAAPAVDHELTKFAEDLVGEYVLAGQLAARQLKMAEDEDGDGDDDAPKKEKAEPTEGGGGPAPQMSEAPPDLVSQMQGGGGDPAGPAGPGGGGGDQADAQELLSLLAEMGMSPGDLVALLKGGGGAPGAPGAGGMPPPDMGGAPAGGGMTPPDMGGAPGGMDPTKMAQAAGLLRLAEYTQKAAAAGQLNVVPANTPAKAAARSDVKRAIQDMINPRRRR